MVPACLIQFIIMSGCCECYLTPELSSQHVLPLIRDWQDRNLIVPFLGFNKLVQPIEERTDKVSDSLNIVFPYFSGSLCPDIIAMVLMIALVASAQRAASRKLAVRLC